MMDEKTMAGVLSRFLDRVLKLEAQMNNPSETAWFHGYALVETTTRALIGTKNEKGTWDLSNQSPVWRELVFKLLRTERAMRHFHALEGFPAVKYLFLDSPSFSHIHEGVKTDFHEFFDWFFEQKLPVPLNNHLGRHPSPLHTDPGFFVEHKGLSRSEILFLQDFLALLCKDPQLTAVHTPSTEYPNFPEGSFFWGAEQVTLAEVFGLPSWMGVNHDVGAAACAPALLGIDCVLMIRSATFGPARIAPPPSSAEVYVDIINAQPAQEAAPIAAAAATPFHCFCFFCVDCDNNNNNYNTSSAGGRPRGGGGSSSKSQAGAHV